MISAKVAPAVAGRMQEQATGLGAAIALLVALLLPLCFNPWGYNAFELPKAALLRLMAGIGAVAVAVAFLLSAATPPRRWRRPPAWLLATLGMASVLILATVFSINRLVSLWGSYQRQQGLLTQSAYLALFLVAVASLDTGRRLRRLWAALVGGSAPVVVYGLAQWVGADPWLWQVDASSPIVSTVGRSNFLGSYLVLVIPLTAALALAQESHQTPRRLLLGLLLAGQVAVLALTQARSAWIGLAAAAVTAICLISFPGRRALGLGRPRTGPLLAGLLLATAAMAVGLASGRLAAGTGSELLRPLQSLLDFSSGSTAARVAIWRAAAELVESRPLLGFGLERLDPAFWRVFPPQLVYYQGREFMVDRAHNLWLDLAVTTGFSGVIVFGALCLVWWRSAWRGLAAAQDRTMGILWLGLLAAATGHLIDMQFSFEVTTTAAVFWLVLAAGFALARIQRAGPIEVVERPGPGAEVSQWVAALVSAALLGAVGIALAAPSARMVQADVAFRQAQDTQLALEVRREHALHAIRLWPLAWRYRTELAALDIQRQDFRSAETQLQVVDQLTADNPEIWRMQADLYAQWALVDPQQQGKAEQLYRRVLRQAPNVARYHQALGLILAQQGDLDSAVRALEQAARLDATDVTAYRNLAIFYRALGRNDDADRAQDQAAYWQQRQYPHVADRLSAH